VEALHGDPQSVHSPRSGPEVKNGRSNAEDGAPERLGFGTVKKEVSPPASEWIALHRF